MWYWCYAYAFSAFLPFHEITNRRQAIYEKLAARNYGLPLCESLPWSNPDLNSRLHSIDVTMYINTCQTYPQLFENHVLINVLTTTQVKLAVVHWYPKTNKLFYWRPFRPHRYFISYAANVLAGGLCLSWKAPLSLGSTRQVFDSDSASLEWGRKSVSRFCCWTRPIACVGWSIRFCQQLLFLTVPLFFFCQF